MVRQPDSSLGFRISGFEPDASIYAIYYHYPRPLEFSRFLREPLKVANQGEIGFSLGSASPFEFLGLRNTRIGASWVFGNGLTVYRVNFGFPF